MVEPISKKGVIGRLHNKREGSHGIQPMAWRIMETSFRKLMTLLRGSRSTYAFDERSDSIVLASRNIFQDFFNQLNFGNAHFWNGRIVEGDSFLFIFIEIITISVRRNSRCDKLHLTLITAEVTC